jgi:hypothetical protein
MRLMKKILLTILSRPGKEYSKILGHLTFFLGVIIITISCNDSSQDKIGSQKTGKILTNERKKSFVEQLHFDTKSNYNLELKRLSELEEMLVDEYGFEGAKLVSGFLDDSTFYSLGNFPTDCPWSIFNTKNIIEFVEANFKQLNAEMPRFVALLKKSCRYIIAEKKENKWMLHYFMDVRSESQKRSFLIYTGWPPNNETSKIVLPYKWKIPKELILFYAVHDGFEINNGAYLLNSKEVGVLEYDYSDNIRIEKSKNGIALKDLLVIIDYGSDFEDCIIRKNGDSKESLIAEWDEDTSTVTEKKVTFFPFLDQLFTNTEEE